MPALKKGYSRMLLNEIVLNDEKPTMAATSMDMMMLAHLSVLEKTGLKVLNIHTYPGVAEGLIEAELP